MPGMIVPSSAITICDFVKQLLVRLEGVELYFRNEFPWHKFLYRLKHSQELDDKPVFLETLRFEWDGSYPRSRDLTEFLNALYEAGCLAVSGPGLEWFTVEPSVIEVWKHESTDPALIRYIDAASATAIDLLAYHPMG